MESLQDQHASGVGGGERDVLRHRFLLCVDVGGFVASADRLGAELPEGDDLGAYDAGEGDDAFAPGPCVVVEKMELVAVLHLLALYPFGHAHGVFKVKGCGDGERGVLVGSEVAVGSPDGPDGPHLRDGEAQTLSAGGERDGGTAALKVAVLRHADADNVSFDGNAAPLLVGDSGIGLRRADLRDGGFSP